MKELIVKDHSSIFEYKKATMGMFNEENRLEKQLNTIINCSPTIFVI